MYKQHTFTKMTEALRQKQIREILDEDLRINRKVLDRTFQSVRAYNESLKEQSPLEELVSWNIDKQISNLQEAIQNVIDGAINNTNMTIANEDISKISTAYNLLVSYIQNFAKSHKLNQRDKGALDMKFNEVEPLLKQLRQILSNPERFNVEVSAQNLGVINHIEQQIKDSNYKGLNLVDFKRIPVSKNNPRPANNYRGYTPAPPRRAPPSDDDDDDDSDGSPRARNQSALRASDFITSLSDRPGARADGSPSFFTTPSQQRVETPSYQTPYQLPSSFTPVEEEDPEEDIQYVSTLSQQTKTPAKTKPPKKNQVSPLTTPIHKLPSSQPQKKFHSTHQRKGKMPSFCLMENPFWMMTGNLLKKMIGYTRLINKKESDLFVKHYQVKEINEGRSTTNQYRNKQFYTTLTTITYGLIKNIF